MFHSRRAIVVSPLAKIVGSFQDDIGEPAAPSIDLISHQHELFEPLITASFPALIGWEHYQRLKPFTSLLRNNSPHRAKAYTIDWEMNNPATGESNRLFTHFAQKHCMLSTSLKVIESGTIRLISPFFNVSASEYLVQAIQLPNASQLHTSSLPDEPRSVTIDAVIFSNGTLQGPDRHGLNKRYTAIRNAEHDEAHSLNRYLKSLSSDPSESLITAFLDSHVARGILTLGEGPESLYWQVRGQEASILKRRLHARGISHLQVCIGRRLQYSPVMLKSAPPTTQS